MTRRLLAELQLGRVKQTTLTLLLILSPLGFVLKHDGSLRRIHPLSHPPGRSVNDGINKDFAHISYLKFKSIILMVLIAGQDVIIFKRDISDAFRNIPVAPHYRWLLGFQWENKFYTEYCLPFGLATALFLFNLFAEAFHWILTSWLH